jgi:hypothetical protein
MNLKQNIAKISAVAGTLAATFSAFAIKAFAVADPAVAEMVTSTGNSLKENLLAGLTTAVPLIVGTTIVFWAYKFITRKIKGSAH